MRIVIVPHQKETPAGKLADADLHFDSRDGVLNGLKIVGFAVWQSQYQPGTLAVTVPARDYTANGERKKFNLVRPAQESSVRGVEGAALGPLKAAILVAYEQSLNTAPARVTAATAVSRQVWQAAQEQPKPGPRRTTTGGRYPLRNPSAPPEPPPHTDDDLDFAF